MIDRLNSRRERFGQQRLSESEEDLIERNINRLLDIKKYTIHVIELTSDANKEDVAEIFSRGTDPKRKLMKKVCEVYPDVRIKWLEDGELPMLKSQDMSLEISSVVEAIERLRGIITKQQETIERLCVLIEKKQ